MWSVRHEVTNANEPSSAIVINEFLVFILFKPNACTEAF